VLIARVLILGFAMLAVDRVPATRLNLTCYDIRRQVTIQRKWVVIAQAVEFVLVIGKERESHILHIFARKGFGGNARNGVPKCDENARGDKEKRNGQGATGEYDFH
jgi:hypothetical protein